MVIVLVLTIVFLIMMSATCSLMEAALYAVPLSYAKSQADRGSRAGKVLLRLKQDIGKPIAAILILNTASNSGGAAVAGATVAALYGDRGVLIFSIAFTLTILYISEIFPKQIGVLYPQRVAMFTALPLALLIKILLPLISISQALSSFIRRDRTGPVVTLEDILSLTEMGATQGAVDHLEGSVIKNVIGLDHITIYDILTPRVVVFRLPETTSVAEVAEDIMQWSHTRIPLYQENEPDRLATYVIQRDIYRELLQNKRDVLLKDLARPLKAVPEQMRCDKLLLQMFEQREHICAVVDEYGGFAGIVTLEDIIEEIVGREIVDEYDLVSDLRAYAQMIRFRKRE